MASDIRPLVRITRPRVQNAVGAFKALPRSSRRSFLPCSLVPSGVRVCQAQAMRKSRACLRSRWKASDGFHGAGCLRHAPSAAALARTHSLCLLLRARRASARAARAIVCECVLAMIILMLWRDIRHSQISPGMLPIDARHKHLPHTPASVRCRTVSRLFRLA